MASAQNIGLNNEEKKGKYLKYILNCVLKIGISYNFFECSYHVFLVDILLRQDCFILMFMLLEVKGDSYLRC